MKKNMMMRVASVLMVAVLLSTCAISGTFAKYVTNDSAEDHARVAKWGVELQIVGNLFGDSYNQVIVKDDDAALTVQSSDLAADVVAPGTKNEQGFTFSLNGTPEVDGVITSEMTIQNVFLKAGTYGVMIPVNPGLITEANFDEFEALYYKDDDAFTAATAFSSTAVYYTLEDEVVVANNYYPVVYTLTGDTATTGYDTADSLKAAADAIADKLGMVAGTPAENTSITYTGTKAFATNDNLAGLNLGAETLTWAWAAGSNTDANADTILGLLKNVTNGTVVVWDGTSFIAPVEYENYCLDTQFVLKITVTQTAS